MKQTTIDKLCIQYNKTKGLTYPSIGYLTFADYHGAWYPLKRKLYEIVNQDGGVTRSPLNGKTYKETARNIRIELYKLVANHE